MIIITREQIFVSQIYLFASSTGMDGEFNDFLVSRVDFDLRIFFWLEDGPESLLPSAFLPSTVLSRSSGMFTRSLVSRAYSPSTSSCLALIWLSNLLQSSPLSRSFFLRRFFSPNPSSLAFRCSWSSALSSTLCVEIRLDLARRDLAFSSAYWWYMQH